MPCSSSLISLCVPKEDYELSGFFFLLLLLNQQNPILQSCSAGFRSGQTKVPLGFKLPRKRIKRWFGSTAFKTGYLEIQDQQIPLEIGSQQRTWVWEKRGVTPMEKAVDFWAVIDTMMSGYPQDMGAICLFYFLFLSHFARSQTWLFQMSIFYFLLFFVIPKFEGFFFIVLPLYERLKSSLKQISDAFTPCQNYLLKTRGLEKENHSVKIT